MAKSPSIIHSPDWSGRYSEFKTPCRYFLWPFWPWPCHTQHVVDGAAWLLSSPSIAQINLAKEYHWLISFVRPSSNSTRQTFSPGRKRRLTRRIWIQVRLWWLWPSHSQSIIVKITETYREKDQKVRSAKNIIQGREYVRPVSRPHSQKSQILLLNWKANLIDLILIEW